jgi:UDP-glucose 4-epimerase
MHDDGAVFVTGGAGFIGSTLVDRMLMLGRRVIVYVNLSTGLIEFLTDARASANFRFIEGDLLDAAKLTSAMAGCDIVFHLE